MAKNNSSSNDRTTLEKDLANLLEYDDVSDEIPEILDNLLQSFFPNRGTTTTSASTNNTSRCKDDLLEHMVAWLGDGGVAVHSFVENVVRLEGGERIRHPPVVVDETRSISSTTGTKDAALTNGTTDVRGSTPTSGVVNRNTQQSAGQWNTTNNNNNNKLKSTKQQQKERTTQKQKQTQHKKDELRRSHQHQEQKRTDEQQRQRRIEDDDRKLKRDTEELIIQNQRKEEEQRRTELEDRARAKRREVQEAKDRKPQPPSRGKATVICGCFGTKCKPLTNCLHCGRIACRKEGYGYCPSCTYLIQDMAQQLSNFAAPGTPMEKAILHKERLLEFDRECTKRTIVLDDQADYFKNSSSTWLSGDERQQAAEQDDTRRKDLHDRKKHVMNLDILG